MIRHSKHITRGNRWRVIRMAILERDGFKCRSCGARGRLEIDHILPVRTHPALAWTPDNLQALCPACHTRKTNAETGRAAPSDDPLSWAKAVRELERGNTTTKGERACWIA